MIEVTLLGTGSPLPDPDRAGPATLVRAGGQTFLVDCGRGVQLRLAAAGSSAGALTALLLTHLHSDHIADLGDLIISRWIATFDPNALPFIIIGPPGTAEIVDGMLKAFSFDIGYRLAHHPDITGPPAIDVREYTEGVVWDVDGIVVRAAPTDHRPVAPTVGFRVEHGGASVVLAGDTVPCASLDALALNAGALVHTVIRKDLVDAMPVQRIRDICDYHSSVEEAADTAARAHVGILVFTHFVPGIGPGGYDEWRAMAAAVFPRQIELGDDLHRVEVHPGVCVTPGA